MSYYHAETPKSIVKTLQIYGFPKGEISIEYFYPPEELFEECINQRTGFINFTVDNNRTDKWCIGISYSENKDKLYELIELIDKYDSLEEIKDEIYNYLGIDASKIYKFSPIDGSRDGNPLPPLATSLFKGFTNFEPPSFAKIISKFGFLSSGDVSSDDNSKPQPPILKRFSI